MSDEFKLIDYSEMIPENEKKKQHEKEVKAFKKEAEKSKGLDLLHKEEIVECQRAVIGMPANCAMCEQVNKELFRGCKNRYLF